MLNKEAIDAISECAAIVQASDAVQRAFGQQALAVLPERFKRHDLEEYLPNRRRARGLMRTSCLKDFAEYTDTHKEEGASVFVRPDSMSAIAVLNLGTAIKAGHADNQAILILEKSPAYYALLHVAHGGKLSQLDVAEFFEDWAENLQFFNEDGEITLNKSIAAIRKLTIESSRKLESNEQSLSASKSAFESAQATSQDPIPTKIEFSCYPYKELSERKFTLRLGVLTGGDKPYITLRIIKHEEHIEDMAMELADKTSEKLGGTVQVLLGDYEKTK